MSFLRRFFSSAPAPAPVPTDAHERLPVLDSEVQGELAAVGGPELPAQLMGMFLGDAPDQLARIRAAQASGDISQVRKVAHSMKGAAASIGAARVEASAKDLEHAARSGEAARIPALTEQLSLSLEQLQAAA